MQGRRPRALPRRRIAKVRSIPMARSEAEVPKPEPPSPPMPGGPVSRRRAPLAAKRSSGLRSTFPLEEMLHSFAAGALFLALTLMPLVGRPELAAARMAWAWAFLTVVAAYPLGYVLLSFSQPLFWVYERLWSAVPDRLLQDIAALTSEARDRIQRLPLDERVRQVLWDMPEQFSLEMAAFAGCPELQIRLMERGRVALFMARRLASAFCLVAAEYLLMAGFGGARPLLAAGALPLLLFSLLCYRTSLQVRKEHLERLLAGSWTIVPEK